eukprot:5099031-Amphidinium_carterae.1
MNAAGVPSTTLTREFGCPVDRVELSFAHVWGRVHCPHLRDALAHHLADFADLADFDLAATVSYLFNVQFSSSL